MTERLLRAQGFCPKHTRQLIPNASPGLLSAVYLPLLQSAAQDLRAIATGGRNGSSSSAWERCPACESVVTSLRYWSGLVEGCFQNEPRRWLERFADQQALCVYHYALVYSAVAPATQEHLDGLLLKGLQEPTAWPLQPAIDDFCVPTHLPDHRFDRAEAGRRWGDAWEELQARLNADTCPVCQWLAESAHDYLAWLHRAVADQPPSQWLQASQLCWSHVHAWLKGISAEVAWRWRTELASWWLVQYQAAKRRQPGRTIHGRDASPGGGRLRAALGVDESTCALCHHLATRLAEGLQLLASALPDPMIWPVYSHSKGLCLRHLRMLLPRLSPADRTQLLAVHQRRVEVIAWTLERLLRLDSWNRRHEPITYEKDGWQLALRTYQGELWAFEPYPRFPQ
ncbi:MAG: hypothetical protein K6U87_06630 [Firmicutes bacterium]|nr:hypothetical protein [Bacillota bacterium]